MKKINKLIKWLTKDIHSAPRYNAEKWRLELLKIVTKDLYK